MSNDPTSLNTKLQPPCPATGQDARPCGGMWGKGYNVVGPPGAGWK